MSVTASGPMSLPLAGLAELTAASATFRTAVGAANAADAMANIFEPDVPLDDEENLPPLDRVIITDSDECQWAFDAYLVSSGSLLWTINLRTDPSYHPESPEALKIFRNTVGAIISEMMLLRNTPISGGGHYWNATKFTRLIAPQLYDRRKQSSPDETAGTYFETTLLVDWV